MALDGAGSVYVAGWSAGVGDAFVRKYDAGGTAASTRLFGTEAADSPTGVAVDAAGNAYVAGYTGLGVGASRFGARVMLDLVDDVRNERTELEFVRSKPLPFPPEPLRYAVIMATKKSIEQADRNEGRRNLWLRALDRMGLGFDS